MPDLITHTVPVYLLYKRRRFVILILFGAILPDLLSRFPNIIFGNSVKWATLPAHSIIFLILLSYFLSLFTRENERFNVFKAILLGAISHIFFDLLQYNVKSYYLIFYPFSFKGYQLGLFWPEEFLYSVSLWIALLALSYKRSLTSIS